jgi:hypothetical protein
MAYHFGEVTVDYLSAMGNDTKKVIRAGDRNDRSGSASDRFQLDIRIVVPD